MNNDDSAERERAEALARFQARSRGETVESDGSYVRYYDYAGFWRRFFANFIDGIILNIVAIPAYALVILTDASWIINIIAIVYVIGFWTLWGKTPGKMLGGIQIVTVDGGDIGLGRSIIRYFGYILSSLIFGIGFLMIAWDSKKQGLHDKLAGTIVIHA